MSHRSRLHKKHFHIVDKLDLLKLNSPKTTQKAIDSLPRYTFDPPSIPSPLKAPRTPGYSHPCYWGLLAIEFVKWHRDME